MKFQSFFFFLKTNKICVSFWGKGRTMVHLWNSEHVLFLWSRKRWCTVPENTSSIPAHSSIFRDSLPALFLWLRGKICNGCPGLSICPWTGAMSVSRSCPAHTHCLGWGRPENCYIISSTSSLGWNCFSFMSFRVRNNLLACFHVALPGWLIKSWRLSSVRREA